ncbi:MAG: AMP-binding protein [Oscillospiraceae bacterium]|nr:AMP-binding protein [Oscillospiraceae bacterium]
MDKKTQDELSKFFLDNMNERAIEKLKPLNNLREFLYHIKKQFSNKKAFVFRKEEKIKSIKYEEMCDKILRLMNFFHEKNEKIAIVAEPSEDWVEIFLSITCSSNVAVIIPSVAKLNSIIGILQMSGAKTVIYDSSNSGNIEKCKTKLENLKYLSLEELMKESTTLTKTASKNITIDQNSPAAIFFTSGTTALSKGVVLTHKNIMLNAFNGMLGTPLPEFCRCLLALPLFHVLGLIRSILTILYQGGEIHFPGSIKTFFKDFSWSHPTVLVLIPEQVSAVANIIKNKGLLAVGNELKTIITGGAAMQAKFKQMLLDYNIELSQGYGLTECLFVCANASKKTKFSSVGKPYPGNMVKIKNGEILIRGDNLFSNYLFKEDTEKSFEGPWFKTGDLGHFDEDGFLYVTGRKKFLIVLANGENISPEKLELKILENSDVKEAMVYETQIGSGTGVLGVEVYAPELEYLKICEIINKINDTLPLGGKMRVITKRDIPFAKTPSNKIIRNGFQNTIFTKLKEAFVKSPLINADPNSIVMDTRLIEDLEMSSVAFADLFCEFEEKFSIKANFDEVSKMLTIRDAYNYLQKNYKG